MSGFVTNCPGDSKEGFCSLTMHWPKPWGTVMARCEPLGRRIGPMDAFIAATAQVHELAVVTRNTSDFKLSVKAVVNPWRQV
jgi:predicted nucleic acid-binding protein